MKFTIEIVRIRDGGEARVLYRSAVEVISPKWAKTQAATLLDAWKQRGANAVRILNRQGEELYSWQA